MNTNKCGFRVAFFCGIIFHTIERRGRVKLNCHITNPKNIFYENSARFVLAVEF